MTRSAERRARDGRQLDLSVKEFGVLEALLRATPAYLRAEDLLEQVWDEFADPFTNTVAVTIGRLRRKLGDPPVIATTPGVGYRIGGQSASGFAAGDPVSSAESVVMARLAARPLARRSSRQPPQGRKAARVRGLCRVCGGSFTVPASARSGEQSRRAIRRG